MNESASHSSSPEPHKEPKVIKRYTNRKLYDTEASRYVTLDEISAMVKDGAEVKIIDNRSKDDLTSVTLAQIIFEEEKKKARMPLAMLREIVRHGGETLGGFLQHQVDHVGQKMASFKEEAEVLRDRILRREAEERSAAEAARASPIDQARDLVSQSQRILDEWQKRLDDRVRHALENIVGSLPAVAKDVAALEKRIDELEKKLGSLEK